MKTLHTLALALLLTCSACVGHPAQDDFWRPWYDDPSQGGEASDGGTVGPSDGGSSDLGKATGGSCSFTASTTMATLAGKYSPRNVGAIWIADSSQRFVKSLYVWANRRIGHLNRWIADSAAAGLPNNRVDAISAATLSGFGARSAQWNCTDAARKPVPSGMYHVCFEITSSNAAGPNDCVPFNVGTGPFHSQPVDTSEFLSRVLEMSP